MPNPPKSAKPENVKFEQELKKVETFLRYVDVIQECETEIKNGARPADVKNWYLHKQSEFVIPKEFYTAKKFDKEFLEELKEHYSDKIEEIISNRRVSILDNDPFRKSTTDEMRLFILELYALAKSGVKWQISSINLDGEEKVSKKEFNEIEYELDFLGLSLAEIGVHSSGKGSNNNTINKGKIKVQNSK